MNLNKFKIESYLDLREEIVSLYFVSLLREAKFAIWERRLELCTVDLKKLGIEILPRFKRRNFQSPFANPKREISAVILAVKTVFEQFRKKSSIPWEKLLNYTVFELARRANATAGYANNLRFGTPGSIPAR